MDTLCSYMHTLRSLFIEMSNAFRKLQYRTFLSFFFFLYSKCGDLEEELKNVTNNLKSLEAQSDKASVVYLS